MAFHRGGRRRSRRSSSSKVRKTHWEGGLFQGNLQFQTDLAGAYTWVSFWARWPSDFIEPSDATFPMPSDETLVRSIVQIAMGTTADSIVNFVYGLIAFDGGRTPDFYETATFVQGSALVSPPNPAVDYSEDWIIRQPIGLIGLLGEATAEYSFPMQAPTFVESRAMRKLPPGTGILGVLGGINVLSSEPVVPLRWTVDQRMAIRSGYTR